MRVNGTEMYQRSFKIYAPATMPASAMSKVDYFPVGREPTTIPLGLAASTCNSGLAGKPFTKHVRLHLPRKRSGHEGVHDAVQPAWNDSGAVFEQTAEALGYALLGAHRFHRHGLRIEAELFEHWCVRKPDCQYSDVDTERL